MAEDRVIMEEGYRICTDGGTLIATVKRDLGDDRRGTELTEEDIALEPGFALDHPAIAFHVDLEFTDMALSDWRYF